MFKYNIDNEYSSQKIDGNSYYFGSWTFHLLRGQKMGRMDGQMDSIV